MRARGVVENEAATKTKIGEMKSVPKKSVRVEQP